MSETLCYALRLDVSDADQPRVSAWVSANSSAFLVVHETAADENPHVHAILHSTKKLPALRAAFKRAFEDKVGNGAYSLKECNDDIEAYMRYMCKGAAKDDLPRVWARQGLLYTEPLCVSAHEEYWVNNASIKSNKRKRSALTGETIVEKLERICKEKGIKSHNREDIAVQYITHYKDARKPINVFSARAVVNTVAVLLDEQGDTIRLLAGQIAGN